MDHQGDQYLDDLYDFPFVDERHLSEVKDWHAVQVVVNKGTESHRFTLQ